MCVCFLTGCASLSASHTEMTVAKSCWSGAPEWHLLMVVLPTHSSEVIFHQKAVSRQLVSHLHSYWVNRHVRLLVLYTICIHYMNTNQTTTVKSVQSDHGLTTEISQQFCKAVSGKIKFCSVHGSNITFQQHSTF